MINLKKSTTAPGFTSLVAEVGGWFRDDELVEWWVREGVRAFAVVAGVSLIPALLIGLVASGLPSAGGPEGPPGVSGVGLPRAVVIFWGLLFYNANAAPFDVGLGGMHLVRAALAALVPALGAPSGESTGVAGFGPLALFAVLVWRCVRAGHRVEMGKPYPGSNLMAAVRAAGMAVPYGVASLIFFIAGRLFLSLGGLAGPAGAPDLATVAVPCLVVAGLAGLGAYSGRGSRSTRETGVLRGLASGSLGVAIGASLALLIAIPALVILGSHGGAAVGHALTPRVLPPPLLAGRLPFPIEAGSFLIALLYVPNLAALAWTQAVGIGVLGLGVLGLLGLVGPVVGALAGALLLGPGPSSWARLGFAAAFACLAALVEVLVVPHAAGWWPAPNPLLVVVLAGALAAPSLVGAGVIGRSGTVVIPSSLRVALTRRVDSWLSAGTAVVPAVAQPTPERLITSGSSGTGAAPSPTFGGGVFKSCPACGTTLRAETETCHGCGARQS
jgi:hypothetical protein